MITENGKRKIALFLKEFYTKGNVGVGGDATNPNGNVLDTPMLADASMVTMSNSTSGNTTIDFKGSFTGSQLTGTTIREFGIFGDLPLDATFENMKLEGVAPETTDGTEATTEQIMLARVNFDGLGPFAATDQVDFILTVEVE
jgi:hypothetical protein